MHTWGFCLFATRLSVHCVHGGMRQAPECLVPGHISVRLRELLKAEKRRFYRCSPFAEICPGAFPTYNTAGRREAIVSICSPLLDRFMIKVSTQYTVNLVGILVGILVGHRSGCFLLYFSQNRDQEKASSRMCRRHSSLPEFHSDFQGYAFHQRWP